MDKGKRLINFIEGVAFMMVLVGGGSMDEPTITGAVILIVGLITLILCSRREDKDYDMG